MVKTSFKVLASTESAPTVSRTMSPNQSFSCESQDGVFDTSRRVSFVYQGWQFFLSAERVAPGNFCPTVAYSMRWPTADERELPRETASYLTKAEALRHAKQQAIRWAGHRSGDGRGQQ